MPSSVEAVIILVFLVSPGVIFFQFARRSIPHLEEPTDIRFLVTMITTGVAVHVIAFPWSNRILSYYLDTHLDMHRKEVFAWAVVVVFGAPALLGAISGQIAIRPPVDWILNKIGLGYIDRMPSAWDYVMQQKAARYVRVHLKGGGVIGGVFGNQSFGSTDPKRSDVYLEQAWILDDAGNFLEPVPTSQGLWISNDVMAYVHFLEGSDTPDEQEQSAHAGPVNTASGPILGRHKARDQGAAGHSRHRQSRRATSGVGKTLSPTTHPAGQRTEK